MIKVIVCGGRAYTNKARVYAKLDALHAERHIELVIHGDQTGADTLAGQWAYDRKVWCWQINMKRWVEYGGHAGPMRNAHMLKLKPDLVVAFAGGRGTRNMVKLATEAGVEVIDG